MPSTQGTRWYLGIRPWYQGIKLDTCGVSKGTVKKEKETWGRERRNGGGWRRGGTARYRPIPNAQYLRYQVVSNLGTKVSSLVLMGYQRVLSKRGGDVWEGGPQLWRMTSRRHDEVRVEARAKEFEKSRGGAEEEVDGPLAGRRGLPASIPEVQKRQAAAGTMAEGEDKGSSRFCPPWDDDSPAHTRPTRAANHSGAARGSELEGDPAEGWPTSLTQCRRCPPRLPETTTTIPSSWPASSPLGFF
uniref:Uncharacterized protein n=1 Tax=Oryza barthii TaxID=65489 RepID=A0A0D3HCE0_9ORYZ